MRRTLIAMLVVLAASLALCTAGRALLNGAVDEARALRERAVQAEEELREVDAAALAERLCKQWAERTPAMLLVASHDVLSDVQGLIDEARVCLQLHDRGDFLRLMANLDAVLLKIRDAEAVSWGNIY